MAQAYLKPKLGAVETAPARSCDALDRAMVFLRCAFRLEDRVFGFSRATFFAFCATEVPLCELESARNTDGGNISHSP